MIKETDFFGRVICQKTCPAYFMDDYNEPVCDINMRLYPDKWDYDMKEYVPLCKLSKEYRLIKNK